MPAKLKIIIMTIICSSNCLTASPLKGLTPTECFPEIDCICFSKPALDILADGLRDKEKCRIESEELRAFIARKYDAKQEKQWYENPSFIVGSVSVSFALGGLVVWALGR